MVTNCQWEPCPVPRVTGANKKERFSFIPFLWFSDHLPQQAGYSDRARLGSSSICQTGRSERTGNYRQCGGVHLLIQTRCTCLSMSSSPVMFRLRSRQGRWKLHSSKCPCDTSSDCSRQANKLDSLLYLAMSEAKVCRGILHTGLVLKNIRDGEMSGEGKGSGESLERKLFPGSTLTFFQYSLMLLLNICYFLK